MLHEGIRRHVGYVLMTHTFPLEGGRDPSLCSQRERTSDHTGHIYCKFISHMRMPQCILKIVMLIKISVFHWSEGKYLQSTLSNFLTHFSVAHAVIT